MSSNKQFAFKMFFAIVIVFGGAFIVIEGVKAWRSDGVIERQIADSTQSNLEQQHTVELVGCRVQAAFHKPSGQWIFVTNRIPCAVSAGAK